MAELDSDMARDRADEDLRRAFAIASEEADELKRHWYEGPQEGPDEAARYALYKAKIRECGRLINEASARGIALDRMTPDAITEAIVQR